MCSLDLWVGEERSVRVGDGAAPVQPYAIKIVKQRYDRGDVLLLELVHLKCQPCGFWLTTGAGGGWEEGRWLRLFWVAGMVDETTAWDLVVYVV